MPRQRGGFTLIELVMVVMLIGIVAGVLAPIIAGNVKAYRDTSARTELVARGRMALARLARELHQSLPYSVHLISSTALEFVSSSHGGRYVDLLDSAISNAQCPPNQRFHLPSNRSTLCLLTMEESPGLVAGALLVIGNESASQLRSNSSPGSWVALNATPTTPATTSALWSVGFASHKFLNASQGRHYFIADFIHEIALNGTELRWRRTAATAAAIASDYDNALDVSGSDALLINGVSSLSFQYLPAADGMLRITLILTEGAESITLHEGIYVRNAP